MILLQFNYKLENCIYIFYKLKKTFKNEINFINF
jgi:hypothetical protein